MSEETTIDIRKPVHGTIGISATGKVMVKTGIDSAEAASAAAQAWADRSRLPCATFATTGFCEPRKPSETTFTGFAAK